jgi:PAS domain-containing protein
MILVSRRNFFLLVLLAAACSLCCGLLGYIWLSEGFSQEVGRNLGSRIEPKIAAERLLFVAVVGTLLVLALAAHIYLRRIRIERTLRRISTLGGTASPALQLRAAPLGSLGETLEFLYRRILEINDKQALKLSGQSELISLLISGSDAPLAVTDVTGTILYLSDKYEKRSEKTRAKLLGSSIEEVESEIVVPMIMQELENYRGSDSGEKEGEQKRKKRSFTVLPILNKQGSVSYLLFDFRAVSPFQAFRRNRAAGKGGAGKNGAGRGGAGRTGGDSPETGRVS